MIDVAALAFDERGLVTVVTQDATTGAVLMVAHANLEALHKTIDTGEMHYFSRKRGLWRKGATSGATQTVASLAADCDGDAVLARVIPAGAACHTGATSCFGAEVGSDAMSVLDAVVRSRVRASSPGERSYTVDLLRDRNLRLKKLGEEFAELLTALADADGSAATEEAADLLYHMVVALRASGVGWGQLLAAIAARQRPGSPVRTTEPPVSLQ